MKKESTKLENWSAMIEEWEKLKSNNKKGIDNLKKLMKKYKGKL